MRVSETEPDWVHMKRLNPYKKFKILIRYLIQLRLYYS